MFHLFFVNDNHYYFFRLHQLLCERLLKIFQQGEHFSHLLIDVSINKYNFY